MEGAVKTPASTGRRIAAAILDFITVFFVGGYSIALMTGATTEKGFSLQGGPAIALFAVIAAYFLIGRRIAGGTLWDRILRIERPQPR